MQDNVADAHQSAAGVSMTAEDHDPKIDVALVRRLVAAQFPRWAGLPLEPVAENGWDNSSFRLGDDMLARLPTAEHYAAQVDKEQQWLPKLAPYLPLPIPAPLALGAPALGYPWRWSVYNWLPGETARGGELACDRDFGNDLARFLTALHRIDAGHGPAAGEHNYHRGGALATYRAQMEDAISRIDAANGAAVARVWEEALATDWRDEPRWVHGDFAPRNLLIEQGRLSAVIDFGLAGVGDPACDLAIAWTFLRGGARRAFRDELVLDPATWARGRGWALWKALILAAGVARGPAADVERAWSVVEEVLATPL